MPAMRAQASAVYIGIITIVASTGPVIVSLRQTVSQCVKWHHACTYFLLLFCLQVPALLDWVSTFYRCSSGLKYALLVVVPSFYLCSSLLFTVLGVVTVWWERRQRKGGKYSTVEHTDNISDNTIADTGVKSVS